MLRSNTPQSFSPFLIVFAIAISSLTGCVTMKQFEELQASCEEIDMENTELRLGSHDAAIELIELEGQIATLIEAREALAADTARLGRFVSEAKDEMDRLRELNDALTDQNGGRLAALNDENRALLEDVGRIRTELQVREDALLVLEADLANRSADLESRSARVEELESLLAAREKSAEVLRKRLENALLGFEGNGLSVEQRDGKVYVSLEAELLFASGSANVDDKGEAILRKLGDVIATQHDLEIIIEGHTDTDRLLSPNIPRNNWELSVLRATSVLAIIMGQPGVDPSVLTAAGKGEFHPVDLEDKSKNRRIEVVLAPRLDDLFDLLDE
ncbi:MAG: cell envelope biogenesis protein OmpA [Crocinitomicaceae bacterium]|nr:cell envelope biogenesis protein OmpA [Crocinitomicaceae bacterium]